jgi:hypothetical protein
MITQEELVEPRPVSYDVTTRPVSDRPEEAERGLPGTSPRRSTLPR